MKIAIINNQTDGSTGKITRMLCNSMIQSGSQAKLFYTGITEGKEDFCVRYSSRKDVKINALVSRISGNYGFESKKATRQLIGMLEEYQPDLVNIHNIHGHDCDYEMLFEYLSKKKIPVVYTVHDTWVFTGYCPAFNWSKCTNWKSGCHDCPQKKQFSWFFDHSAKNQKKKVDGVKGIKKFTFVTPSKWMTSQIQLSPMRGVNSIVIPNGIDTNIFDICEEDVKKKLGIEGKYMLLSVAFSVSGAKGLSDLMELRKKLSDEYVMVLVGLPENVISMLPAGMIGVQRTANQKELAQYYSSADVLVNPTHQDNFPTVNLEALACGTPIVTYQVDGAYEAFDEATGIAVKEYDTDAMAKAIEEIAPKKQELAPLCRKHAVENYSEELFVSRYMKLFSEMVK